MEQRPRPLPEAGRVHPAPPPRPKPPALCTHGMRMSPCRLPSFALMVLMKTLKCPPGLIRAELLEARAAVCQVPASCGATRGQGEARTLPSAGPPPPCPAPAPMAQEGPAMPVHPAGSRMVPVCGTSLLGPADWLACDQGKETQPSFWPRGSAQHLPRRRQERLHSLLD